MVKIYSIIILLLISGCNTSKPFHGRKYNIVKNGATIASVLFYKNDSCIIDSHTGKIKAMWNDNDDTITLKSRYSEDSIKKVSYSLNHTNSPEIKISITPDNLKSLVFSSVSFFDSNKRQVAHIAYPDSIVSYNSTIAYFVLGMYRAKTDFMPYTLDTGCSINIWVDYCDDVIRYPYDLHEKLIFKDNQLYQLE